MISVFSSLGSLQKKLHFLDQKRDVSFGGLEKRDLCRRVSQKSNILVFCFVVGRHVLYVGCYSKENEIKRRS